MRTSIANIVAFWNNRAEQYWSAFAFDWLSKMYVRTILWGGKRQRTPNAQIVLRAREWDQQAQQHFHSSFKRMITDFACTIGEFQSSWSVYNNTLYYTQRMIFPAAWSQHKRFGNILTHSQTSVLTSGFYRVKPQLVTHQKIVEIV